MQKRTLIILFVNYLYFHVAIAQCTITAYGNSIADTVEICLGDPVTLSLNSGCPNYFTHVDFNYGYPGVGWSSTNQAMYNNPCAYYSADSTIYLWMGSISSAPRRLESPDFDVSSGGTIRFEMLYAIQGQPSPCEGPDQYNEGIAIQYSTNSGVAWHLIEYYAPNGTVLTYIPTESTPGASGQTPFTIWTERTVSIPSAAQTTSTRFRWIQFNATSSPHDHWGLDNIRIPINPIVSIWWAHGHVGTLPHIVTPNANTTYTAFLSDGIDTVQSKIYVKVINCAHISNFENEIYKTINMYPNINNGSFIIELKKSSFVEIYNVLGGIVYNNHFEEGRHNINISYLSEGTYVLYSKTKDENETVKFTIIK